MKKLLKVIGVLVLTLILILNVTFKVSGSGNLVEVNNKASIRKKTNNQEQGLRFYATLDETVKDQEHGFYVVYGNATLVELNDAISNANNGVSTINDKEVFKVSVSGVNSNNEYSVILIGIPIEGYADRITVFGYVKDIEEVISITPATRSIAEVALRLLDDPIYASVSGDIVSEVNNLIYYADFESSKESNYINNVISNLGVNDGVNFIINGGSGILYDYTDDLNIGLSNGTNLLRINGTNTTTLTSEVIDSLTKISFDAKYYKDYSSGVLKVYAKGEDDLEFNLVSELNIESTFKTFTLDINKINVELKIEATGGIFNIDNIKMYGLVNEPLKHFNVIFNIDDELVEVLVVGEKVSEPIYEPYKEGNVFEGWYTDSSYNTPYDFNNIVSEDITLYAKFIEKVVDVSETPYINVNQVAYYVNVGDSFTPPVLTAYDDIDDDFNVTTSSYYDTSSEGEYVLSYVAVDSSSNEFEVIIRLYVVPTPLPPAPSGFPMMKESELASIRSRWETTRNGITAGYSLDNFNIYDYYSSLENLEGTAFFNELRSIITVTQTSYGNVRFILEKSDIKHSIWGSYQYGFYDGKKLIRYWDADVSGHALSLNREHVWPRSYLGVNAPGAGTRNIASDIHNLRAIDETTNRIRSNYYFVDSNGNNKVINGNTYYPGDDHKGDVARIMFYMHVRYSSDIYLTNNSSHIASQTKDPLGRIPFGLLDVLLKWHKEDPVDDFERHRNNVIYTYQGNRNPFIDHPEYASVIFEQVEETNEFIVIYMEVFIDTKVNLNDLKPKYEVLVN